MVLEKDLTQKILEELEEEQKVLLLCKLQREMVS